MADKVGGGAWYYVGGGTEPNSPIEVVPAEKRQLPPAAMSATIAATSNRCGIFWRMQNFFCSRKANLFQLWGPPEPTFMGSPDPKAGLEKGIWILPWVEVSEICFEIKRVNFRCTLKSPSNKSIRVHVVSQTCVAHSAVWRPCRDTTDCCYACCLEPTRPKSPPPSSSLFFHFIHRDAIQRRMLRDYICLGLRLSLWADARIVFELNEGLLGGALTVCDLVVDCDLVAIFLSKCLPRKFRTSGSLLQEVLKLVVLGDAAHRHSHLWWTLVLNGNRSSTLGCWNRQSKLISIEL